MVYLPKQVMAITRDGSKIEEGASLHLVTGSFVYDLSLTKK